MTSGPRPAGWVEPGGPWQPRAAPHLWRFLCVLMTSDLTEVHGHQHLPSPSEKHTCVVGFLRRCESDEGLL